MLKHQQQGGFKDRRKQHKGHNRGTPPPNLLTEKELREFLEQTLTSDESENNKPESVNITTERGN